MKIVVATVTYNNSCGEVLRFAKSLKLAQSEVGSKHEVCLCFTDNGSPSDLDSHFSSSIKIASGGNIGFAQAMNRLLKSAFDGYGAEAVISANPDGVFHYMTINRLAELADACQEALIEAIQFPMELSKVYDPVTLDTAWASWCCLLLPRVIYETVGPLDEHFFMYLEDVDYSWRARLAGFGVKLCVGGLYAHPNAARMYEEPSQLFTRYNLESGRYLGWKWDDLRFSRYCERSLVAKGFYASMKELPNIGADVHKIDDPRASSIACFDEPYFTFGKVRW